MRRTPVGSRRSAALATAAAVAVVVTACGGGSGDNPFGPAERAEAGSTTTTEAPVRPMEVAWTVPGQFVTRPVVVGGRVVSFLAEAGGLVLVAYDPASGTEVWRRESTVSNMTPGIVFDVTSDENRVFHVAEGSRESYGYVEAIDAATGTTLWQTDEALLGDSLSYCDDAETVLCTSEQSSSSGSSSVWEIAPDTGEVTEDHGTDGRFLGEDLVDLTGSRDVARVVEGEVVWQRQPSELFQGAPVSSDWGWWWRDSGDLYIGWLGTDPGVEEPPDVWDMEISPDYIAGIDIATGETRWVTEGDPVCGWRLPTLDLEVDDAEPWIRCHITGTVHLENNDAVAATIASAVMEGFDPATGTATWTVDLGVISGLYVDTQLMLRLGPTRFALQRDDGTMLAVDVEAGTTVELAGDEVAWCFSENMYPYADYDDEYPDNPVRQGADFTTPCDLAGSPQPGPTAPDEGIGATAGDVFAWMDAGGLHGARAPG